MCIELFTVITEENSGSRRFCDSLDSNGWRYHVRGFGAPYFGHAWRFKKLVAAIRAFRFCDVVACVDAYDSICLESPAVAFDRFQEIGKPILFSFEPDKRPEPWLSLNAGGWIAERSAVLDVFTDKLLDELFPDHFNDQDQLQAFMGSHPDLIALDLASKVFYTSNEHRQSPASHPVFVHGPNRADLSWIERERAYA